jgi:UDP-N-acetylglucosamine transferase subunit ALG13
MIFFTLGTASFPFDRSILWLEKLLTQEIITEPVLLQHGVTPVRIQHPLLTAVASLSSDEMFKAVSESSLVVSHAGQGSTRMLASRGASFVLLPRLKKFGEHIDDHQLLFATAVEKLGVNYCIKIEDLTRYIQHPPRPFKGELLQAPSLASYLSSRFVTA